jgi:hypothetical protein
MCAARTAQSEPAMAVDAFEMCKGHLDLFCAICMRRYIALPCLALSGRAGGQHPRVFIDRSGDLALRFFWATSVLQSTLIAVWLSLSVCLKALGDHRIEHMTQHIAVAEMPVPVLEKRRVVWS